MKKVLFPILALVLALGLALPMGASVAEAGVRVNAQRVPLYPVANGNSDYVLTNEPSQGTVNFVDPMGNVTFIIQGNMEGLTPNRYHTVWIRDLDANDPGYEGPFINNYAPLGYYLLDTFTTNGEGRGKFHLNIRAEVLSIGTYEIQLAINEPPTWDPDAIGPTVLATEKWVTVTIQL